MLEQKDKEDERKVILAGVVKSWNRVVAGLLQSVKAWDEYSTLRLENDIRLEEFPVEYQRTLMLANPKGQLDFIIEDMITHGKYFSDYLKTQLIKL